jgi:hypothetical protein
MTTAARIAEDYIAVWNEPDASARRARLAAGWTTGAAYADPIARADGVAAISELIAGVQGRFPAFRFALAGEPSGHGEFVRFRWTLGPAEGEPPIEGSDVVVLDGGRISRVIGFLDKLPQ